MAEISTDAAQEAAGAALESAARDLAARLAVLIGRLDSTGGKLDPGQARQVRELADQVRAFAADRMPAVLETLPPHLVEAARQATAGMPSMGRFAPEITEDLQRIWAGRAVELAAEISDTAAEEVARAVTRAVAASTPIAEVAPEVARALSTTVARARVAVDRGVRDFAEAAVLERGKRIGGEILYLYEGPAGGPIRPYCAARVGKVLTEKQARALDPGARFNCRHNLVALTPDEAKGFPRL